MASGSMTAARGSQKVGESWWMWCLWMYSDGGSAAVGEEEAGAKWEARLERRLRAVDMVWDACSFGGGRMWPR